MRSFRILYNLKMKSRQSLRICSCVIDISIKQCYYIEKEVVM